MNPVPKDSRGGKRRIAYKTALTPAQVREARELRMNGASYKDLQRTFEVSRNCMRCALYGLGSYAGM